jgi:preprotein translocase subunit SecA
LLDYDDVMNKQRVAIYGLRRDVLKGERLDEIITEMLSDVTSDLLDLYADDRQRSESWNVDGLVTAMMQQFGIQISAEAFKPLSTEHVTKVVGDAVKVAFEKQKATLGEYFQQVEKMVLLQTIDQRWKEHLQAIDQMREWINLRAYAQKDPLIEYKQEAFKTFGELNISIRAESVEKLMKIQLVAQNPMESLQNAEDYEIEDESGANEDPQLGAGQVNVDADATAEALEAMKPKARTRLQYSSGPVPAEGKAQGSRADRRGDKGKKKKLF